MPDGISANQTAQHPLMLRITDGNLTATLGTFVFEAQSVQLVANATNYVFLDLSQEPPALTVNQSGFPATAVWTIAIAVTNNTKITQLTDSRPAFNNLLLAGGGTPGGSTKEIQFNLGGTFAGNPALTYDPVAANLELNPTNVASMSAAFVELNSPSGNTTLIMDATGPGAESFTVQANDPAGGTIQFTSSGDMTIAAGGNFQFSGGSSPSNTMQFAPQGPVKFNSTAAKYQFVGVPVFANNAAAISGGLAVGDLYRTGANPDSVCIVH